MKKILVLVIAAALLFPLSSYYLGIKAQESLETQHRVLAETFFIESASHEYQRGLFLSRETAVMRVKPSVLKGLKNTLPENLLNALDKPVTLSHRVRHYPFAAGLMPVRAVVDTELVFHPDTEKTLQRFFGSQTPLVLHNTVRLNGSGTLQFNIAAFDYEELSGIKLNWQGMNGTVDYNDDFSDYQTRFALPGFKVVLADKGSLNAENLSFSAHTVKQDNLPLSTGSSETSLSLLEVVWQDKIAYDIRINDLIGMISDLQVGAFINPYGDVPPGRIRVENFRYATRTDSLENGFIDSNGKFVFDKLHYGEETYGPLHIEVAAEHLDAAALSALKQRWQESVARYSDTNRQREQILAAVRNEGSGIFTRNPVFKLRQFSFATPQGHIKADGEVSFAGLAAEDLNHLPAMLKKMQAALNFDVSRSLIERFAIAQARGLFTIENPDDIEEQKEINNTIRLLTEQTINHLVAEGFAVEDGNAVKTILTIGNNTITLNGKPFDTSSPDDDLYDESAGKEISDVSDTSSDTQEPLPENKPLDP